MEFRFAVGKQRDWEKNKKLESERASVYICKFKF